MTKKADYDTIRNPNHLKKGLLVAIAVKNL